MLKTLSLLLAASQPAPTVLLDDMEGTVEYYASCDVPDGAKWISAADAVLPAPSFALRTGPDSTVDVEFAAEDYQLRLSPNTQICVVATNRRNLPLRQPNVTSLVSGEIFAEWASPPQGEPAEISVARNEDTEIVVAVARCARVVLTKETVLIQEACGAREGVTLSTPIGGLPDRAMPPHSAVVIPRDGSPFDWSKPSATIPDPVAIVSSPDNEIFALASESALTKLRLAWRASAGAKSYDLTLVLRDGGPSRGVVHRTELSVPHTDTPQQSASVAVLPGRYELTIRPRGEHGIMGLAAASARVEVEAIKFEQGGQVVHPSSNDGVLVIPAGSTAAADLKCSESKGVVRPGVKEMTCKRGAKAFAPLEIAYQPPQNGSAAVMEPSIPVDEKSTASFAVPAFTGFRGSIQVTALISGFLDFQTPSILGYPGIAVMVSGLEREPRSSRWNGGIGFRATYVLARRSSAFTTPTTPSKPPRARRVRWGLDAEALFTWGCTRPQAQLCRDTQKGMRVPVLHSRAAANVLMLIDLGRDAAVVADKTSLVDSQLLGFVAGVGGVIVNSSLSHSVGSDAALAPNAGLRYMWVRPKGLHFVADARWVLGIEPRPGDYGHFFDFSLGFGYTR